MPRLTVKPGPAASALLWLGALCSWPTAACAEPRADEAVAAFKAANSTFRDVGGVVDKRRSLQASRVDASERVWRWQAAELHSVSRGTIGQAQAVGLEVELPESSSGPVRPWSLLNQVGVTLNTSGTRAAEWALSAGRGPVSLDVSRVQIAWWLGLRSVRRRLQINPVFGGVAWGLDCYRMSVSDGNRVQDCHIQADPEWASWHSQAVQLYGVAHRRVALISSPYYWSPVSAETSAGIGLKTRIKHGAWSVQGQIQQLLPLNTQTVSSRRYSFEVQWQLLPPLRIGASIAQDRSGAPVDPYRSATTEVFLECRCLDGGPLDAP